MFSKNNNCVQAVPAPYVTGGSRAMLPQYVVTAGPRGCDGKEGRRGEKGPTGEALNSGYTGPTGERGLHGSLITVSNVAPNFLPPGVESRDIFINISNGDLYNTVDGNWNLTGSLLGPTGLKGEIGFTGPLGETGEKGDIGSLIYTGAVPPSFNPSSTGSLYVNTENGNIYHFISGHWAEVANIRGPTGKTGPTGPTGEKGAIGSLWYYGEGIPLFTPDSTRSIYYNTCNANMYYYLDGTWTYFSNIRGMTGPTGTCCCANKCGPCYPCPPPCGPCGPCPPPCGPCGPCPSPCGPCGPCPPPCPPYPCPPCGSCTPSNPCGKCNSCCGGNGGNGGNCESNECNKPYSGCRVLYNRNSFFSVINETEDLGNFGFTPSKSGVAVMTLSYQGIYNWTDTVTPFPQFEFIATITSSTSLGSPIVKKFFVNEFGIANTNIHTNRTFQYQLSVSCNVNYSVSLQVAAPADLTLTIDPSNDGYANSVTVLP
jgi:hypothetical protein